MSPPYMRTLSEQERIERVENLYKETIASFAEDSLDKTVETLTDKEREYYRKQVELLIGKSVLTRPFEQIRREIHRQSLWSEER